MLKNHCSLVILCKALRSVLRLLFLGLVSADFCPFVCFLTMVLGTYLASVFLLVCSLSFVADFFVLSLSAPFLDLLEFKVFYTALGLVVLAFESASSLRTLIPGAGLPYLIACTQILYCFLHSALIVGSLWKILPHAKAVLQRSLCISHVQVHPEAHSCVAIDALV